MRHFFIVLLLLFGKQQLFAQKPPIDSTTYSNWPELFGEPKISGDGKYIAYFTKVPGLAQKDLKYTIQSTVIDWKASFFNIDKGSFTSDSRYMILRTQTDTLITIDLNDQIISQKANVTAFSIPVGGSGDWLIYTQDTKEKTSTLINLKTNKQQIFPGVDLNWFDHDGKYLLLQGSVINKQVKSQFLDWIDLKTGKISSVWKGKDTGYPSIDFKHKQLAFKINNEIWHYKIGMKAAVCISCGNDGLNKNERFGQIGEFSENGKRFFVYVMRNSSLKIGTVNKNAPEVWSYFDAKLQSVQEMELENAESSYLSVIDLTDKNLIHLQKYQNEFFFNRQYDDIILSSYQPKSGDYREIGWNTASSKKYDIVDTKTGTRRSLDFIPADALNIQLSPHRKYIVYFDVKQGQYIIYNIGSGKQDQLTKGINTSWFVTNLDYNTIRGIAAWAFSDSAVFIYDSHDIWKLDPACKGLPVNITKGYGQKNNIVFDMIAKDKGKEIGNNTPLILTAFDKENKNNGFFNTIIGGSADPVQLTMGPYLYKANMVHSKAFDFTPLKAKNKDVYLVRRQCTDEAPNYFCSSDFRTFKRITDLAPHKSYNWYTSELHRWKSLDGKSLQGIMYKPENFDPHRKYPVIFYYYEKLSDGLNKYLRPDFSGGPMDIPTYVSNGYLVFCPDIHYTKGDPMQGTYDAVISGAKYISTFPYVNSDRIGLQGHSFGAIQTNYLVTHSNLFAAACAASGISDWISAYGSLYGNQKDGYNESMAANFEGNGQFRMGKSLWESLDGFIKNSSILGVNKVTTPILLEQGKNDPICSYLNSMEFFLGLRRLGKKAWLLMYPNGDHQLYGKDATDFTKRMQQFFDYYLKETPAPIWMLDGVSPRERGNDIENQLDSGNRKPPTNLLTQDEQVKIDSLTNGKSRIMMLK